MLQADFASCFLFSSIKVILFVLRPPPFYLFFLRAFLILLFPYVQLNRMNIAIFGYNKTPDELDFDFVERVILEVNRHSPGILSQWWPSQGWKLET